jgi:hypothetical protein
LNIASLLFWKRLLRFCSLGRKKRNASEEKWRVSALINFHFCALGRENYASHPRAVERRGKLGHEQVVFSRHSPIFGTPKIASGRLSLADARITPV